MATFHFERRNAWMSRVETNIERKRKQKKPKEEKKNNLWDKWCLSNVQLILRFAFLVATRSVRLRQGRRQTFYRLSRKLTQSIQSLLMIFLSFLDTALLNLVVLLSATADERHRTQYYCASGWRIGAPRTDLHLATKITWANSTVLPTPGRTPKSRDVWCELGKWRRWRSNAIRT